MKIFASYFVLSLFGTLRGGFSQTLRPTNAGRLSPDAKPGHGPRTPSAPVPTIAPVVVSVPPTPAPAPYTKPNNPPRAPGSTSKPRGQATATTPTKPPPPEIAVRISVGVDGTVCAVDPDGNLDISSDGVYWTRLLTGGVQDVAVARSGQIWYTSTSHVLYRRNGYNWDVVANNADFVETDAINGNVAYVYTATGAIYLGNGYTDSPGFAAIPMITPAVRVAFTANYLLYIDQSEAVQLVSLTTPVKGPPTAIGIYSKEISGAHDGTCAISLVSSPGGYTPYSIYYFTNESHDFTSLSTSPVKSGSTYLTALDIAVQSSSFAYYIDASTSVVMSTSLF